jgi:Zn finger protein HypA/HybF involved in hydrogenase expression
MAETTQVDQMEALKLIIAQMSESNREQMMAFAAELKKPTAMEQKKLDEEEARIKRAQTERLELSKAEVERKRLAALGCGHIRVHPGTGVVKHLWRAQVHTPAGQEPYFVPTCQGCHTQTGKIPASMDMIRNGVNLDQYPGLTKEALDKWALQYGA